MPVKTRPAPKNQKKKAKSKGKARRKAKVEKEVQVVSENGNGRYTPAPSKPTLDEIRGAIAGDLKPRDQTGAKKQDELGQKDELGRPTGRPLGLTTGLPIGMAVCYALIQNEKAGKKNKFTDTALAQWLRDEFPGRPSKVFSNISYLRYRYNSGYYTQGAQPAVRSNQYDEKGDVIPGRRRSDEVEVVAG